MEMLEVDDGPPAAAAVRGIIMCIWGRQANGR